MAYTFKHGERPVDGYTIQRAVGRGGFGEVYYAISDGGREVAIKYLCNNPQIELRGVSNCINLKSPYLVAIFDVKKTVDDEYAIIMEYCSGPSLRDLLIAEPNGFEPQKAAYFVREIGKGLAYLHDRGIVHRDLKPGNIFFDDGYVKIGDYGLSKMMNVSRHSGQTASVGTVHYMAPEIGSGNYSKGVDIYALGVMLYEMLLGKVPFEGSSMAEILMKHLTAQPELDELPQPFGNIIRKALQKDPNDRYQTADEMIEELLDVDTVRQSLAGFSAKSLEGAVRHSPPNPMNSPIPSPNPMPGFTGEASPPPFAKPLGNFAISKRLGKKMDRVARKMDAKMVKLGHAPAYQTPPPLPVGPDGSYDPAAAASPFAPLTKADRRKRMLLSAMMSIGMAIGLCVLVGSNSNEEAGAAAGMLVVFMAGAVVLSRGAIRWFGASQGPIWAQRMIRLCCSAPLLAAGVAPLLDSNSENSAAGSAILVTFLLLMVLLNWEKTIERAQFGELRFGKAIGTAAIALGICLPISAIFGDGDPNPIAFLIAAGVTGAVSLIIQATAWWLPARATRAVQKFAGGEDYQHGSMQSDPHSPHPTTGEGSDFDHPASHHDGGMSRPAAPTDAGQVVDMNPAVIPLTRWMITRVFWGFLAFGLMSASIVTFLIPLVSRQMYYHDITASIIACTGTFAFMIFALRKTTPYKRIGFWRETIRPFLISTSMFAIGGTITGIAREWSHEAYDNWACVPDEGRVLMITGLVLSSLVFIVLGLFTGRLPKPPKPFLMNENTAPAMAPASLDETLPIQVVATPSNDSETA